MERELELVLYGATGFTGRLAAQYLSAHAPPDLRWAVAGRDPGKLAALREELRGTGPAACVQADAGDPASLAALARRARVVASTAGPFARWSDGLVAACVEAGTHYVDITGETPWVRSLIDRHHARAEGTGTRIVPLCGFDSVPSDLGAWVTVDAIRRAWGQSTRRVVAGFRLHGGGLNGGTAASALDMAEAGQFAALNDPLLLVPSGGSGAVNPAPARRRAGWEPRLTGWLAPFVMAPVNQQVVLRSAAIAAARGAPYGPRFAWDEGLRTGGRVSATTISAALRVGDGLLRSRLGRRLLRRLAPAPGEGPSERARQGAAVEVDYVGEAEDGRLLRARLHCAGDAGNAVTVRFLCEGALGLARAGEQLPDAGRGGVLTPATALGPVLLERLRAAGVTLEAELSGFGR